MDPYSTEEEQVEALRRWWQENGRSITISIILALGLGFGYQGWKNHSQDKTEQASDLYQGMLQAFNAPALAPEQLEIAVQMAQQLKADYAGSTYAQFAALQLARVAVARNDIATAQAELRWALGKADKGGDVARIAQLRLARVLAANGEPEQALLILEPGAEGPYTASYAVARGDILLSMDRVEEASQAYAAALELAASDRAAINLVAVQQKLQALNPIPARTSAIAATPAVAGESTNVPTGADAPPVDGVDNGSDNGSDNSDNDAGNGQED